MLRLNDIFFFSSRRRHRRWTGDWSSDVCSSDLSGPPPDTLVGVGESVGRVGLEGQVIEVGIVQGVGRRAGRTRATGTSRAAARGTAGRAAGSAEIGRASCREGGWSPGGGAALKQ